VTPASESKATFSTRSRNFTCLPACVVPRSSGMVAATSGPAGGAPGGKKRKIDRRKGVNWMTDWKRKKEAKKGKAGSDDGGGAGGEESRESLRKKAVALIKGLRRAAKKARTFEVRKVVRKLGELKESGGADAGSKLQQLEALHVALKGVDLDAVVARAVAAVPDVDPAVVPKC
jgi:hypothetical protein